MAHRERGELDLGHPQERGLRLARQERTRELCVGQDRADLGEQRRRKQGEVHVRERRQRPARPGELGEHEVLQHQQEDEQRDEAPDRAPERPAAGLAHRAHLARRAPASSLALRAWVHGTPRRRS